MLKWDRHPTKGLEDGKYALYCAGLFDTQSTPVRYKIERVPPEENKEKRVRWKLLRWDERAEDASGGKGAFVVERFAKDKGLFPLLREAQRRADALEVRRTARTAPGVA